MRIKDFKSFGKLNEGETKNYMFFQNLKTIKEAVDKMLALDPAEVDSILKNGHDWANDHIATSKDDIEEVCGFLCNAKVQESEGKKETELFNADDVRRQLQRQDASAEEIDDYIKRNLDRYKPGDRYSMDAGAPGIGKFVYKVTKVTHKSIFGIYLEDESTVRDLDPSEVI